MRNTPVKPAATVSLSLAQKLQPHLLRALRNDDGAAQSQLGELPPTNTTTHLELPSENYIKERRIDFMFRLLTILFALALCGAPAL
jgi:hypothetical protein